MFKALQLPLARNLNRKIKFKIFYFILSLLAGFALLAPLTSVVGQVVPDGTTATTTGTHPDGTSLIIIAPSISDGLSYNAYEQFDVGSGGIYVDNRIEGARTIVNEVTSDLRSHLLGDIEVLGSRAHFILANPNGISVNGTTFINTGGVVLGVGKIELVNRTVAPFTTQLNAVLTTSDKDLDISGTGLSGEIGALQLYAGKMRIDGPVTNTNTDPSASIDIRAGWSEVEFDSSVLPLSSVQAWSTAQSLGGSSSDVLIDVTPQGSLSASRVYMAVSDKGAGVRFAGKGYASIGDFTLDASGNISVDGGQIRGHRHVKIRQAPADSKNNITLTSRGEVQSKIEAVNGGLLMLAQNGSIENFGGLLQGAVKDPLDPLSLGGVTLEASDDISFLTSNADHLAIAFASNGDLDVKAGKAITNTHGRLLANGTVNIDAGTVFSNKVVNTLTTGNGVVTTTSSRSKRLWYWLWLARKVTNSTSVSYGDLSVPDQLAYVVGEKVNIKAPHVENLGGEIDANVSSVFFDADTIVNEGMVIGSMEMSESCTVVCYGEGKSDVRIVGGKINAATDINLTATQTIKDKGGQLLALKDLNVNADKVTIDGLRIPTVVSRPSGLRGLFHKDKVWTYEQDKGGIWISADGSVNVTSPHAIDISAGQITWGTALNAPNGINQVSSPTTISPVGKQFIGSFYQALQILEAEQE